MAQPRQATLQLGELEGIWAVTYTRRVALEQKHYALLGDVLDAIRVLDWATVIDRARHYLLLNPDLTPRQLGKYVARDVEQLIAGRLPSRDWFQWHTDTALALKAAQAEGTAQGLALIGDAAGVSIDWDLAATAAQQALSDAVVFDQATGWMAAQTKAIGHQLGQAIATGWINGDTVEDLTQAVQDLLGSSKSLARAVLDQAVASALSTGATDTYKQAGLEMADYVTAGDGRVCPACGEAEDGNSYTLDELPRPPLHVRCRCTVAPAPFTPTGPQLALVAPYVDSTGLEDAA